MRNLANFLLFQIAWFAAVRGAAGGHLWVGPGAVLALVAVHLALVGDRARELRFVLGTALAGASVDTLLVLVGVTAYPTSAAAWPHPLVPPWIVALWAAFATLPRFSLAWLAHRPARAAVLGGIGGPLSYLAGVRMGAVAVGESAAITWSVLAVEYAVATPLLLWLAHRSPRGGRQEQAATMRLAHDVPSSRNESAGTPPPRPPGEGEEVEIG